MRRELRAVDAPPSGLTLTLTRTRTLTLTLTLTLTPALTLTRWGALRCCWAAWACEISLPSMPLLSDS